MILNNESKLKSDMENIDANGEIAHYEQYLITSQSFQNCLAEDFPRNASTCRKRDWTEKVKLSSS